MALECAHCGTSNPDVASFCRNCGAGLETVTATAPVPGETPHPDPVPPPKGYTRINWAANLYYGWEAAGGGEPLLGTEPIALTVFNGGYDLAQVALGVRGEDKTGRRLLTLQREIERWPRGQAVRLDIASYEMPDPVYALYVELLKAEFGQTD